MLCVMHTRDILTQRHRRGRGPEQYFFFSWLHAEAAVLPDGLSIDRLQGITLMYAGILDLESRVSGIAEVSRGVSRKV